MVRVTWKSNVLDFIFPMPISLGNEKSFGKWVKAWFIYHNFSHIPMTPAYSKNKIKNVWLQVSLWPLTWTNSLKIMQSFFLLSSLSSKKWATKWENFYSLLCQSFNSSYYVLYITVSKVKLVTEVKGDPKAPFLIATTPRCRGGRYSFPWIVPLYPWYVPYDDEC